MMTFDRSITESITYNRSIKECLLDVYEKSLAEGSTYNNQKHRLLMIGALTNG